MPTFRISPDCLTDTKFATAQQKASAANSFIRFVDSDFDAKKFTTATYELLHLHFCHSAHYNKAGFYLYWFERRSDQIEFLDRFADTARYCTPHLATLRPNLWEDVKVLFSGEDEDDDDESNGDGVGRRWLEAHRLRVVEAERAETEKRERAALAWLSAKYATN